MTLTQKLNAVLITLSGAGFLLFGIWLLMSPLEGLAQFGLTLAPEITHRVEIRAFYGGLEIGLGLLLLKFGLSRRYRRAGLWLVTASYGALGAARTLAIVLETDPIPSTIWIALAVELALGGLGVLGLLADDSRQDHPA